MVPLLLLAIPAGAIVDRFNHKHLLLIAQVGMMVTTTVLAVATLANKHSIPLILVTALAGGCSTPLGGPLGPSSSMTWSAQSTCARPWPSIVPGST